MIVLYIWYDESDQHLQVYVCVCIGIEEGRGREIYSQNTSQPITIDVASLP